MGIEKFAAGAGKATWDHYKSGFFKYLERKAKEGAKRYSLLGKLRDAWMNVDWGYAAQEYLKYIYEFHSQFQVFGIGEQNLNELSTNVFLLDEPEFRRYASSERAEKINGLKLVFRDQRGKKLLVWGEPGAGKTTFLKQIVTYAVEKSDYIPLFINIAEWLSLGDGTYESLLQYLADQFKRCGFEDTTIFIEYVIEEGKAIMLFDGLDEISWEKQKKVISLLEQHGTSKSKIIVSCRVDAISSGIKGFWEVQVARWDARRIRDFIEKRFPDQDLRNKFTEALDDQKRKSLQEFKKNPLLLSLLCHAFNPEKGFPINRASIYFEATRHLLLERDQEKNVSREPILDGLTLAQKEFLYAHLAYDAFNRKQIYFTQQDLEQRIYTSLKKVLGKNDLRVTDSSIILPKLISQHGILSRRGHRTYTFSHLTIQEYYTAKYITEINNKDKLEKLMTNITDPLWHEVFLLTSSLLLEATPWFQIMQKSIQDILANNSKLLYIQKWTNQRVDNIQAYKNIAKRALYWYLATSFAYNRVDELDLTPSNNQIRKTAINLSRSLDHTLGHVPMEQLDLAYRPDSEISFTEELDLAIEHSNNLIEVLYPQSLNTLKYFLFEVSTSNLILILSIIDTILDADEKLSKKQIKVFQNALSLWQNMPDNPLSNKSVISCPSYKASNQIWHEFRNNFQKIIEKMLEIDLSIAWDETENEIAEDYLSANQLFWNCMQTAKTENRVFVEDMILKPPEENQ